MAETLDLEKAAKMLYASESTLLELIAKEEINAAKIGRKWVFIDVDLIEYVRSKYASNQKAKQCHSISEVKYGTTLSRSMDKELENLLTPVTRRKHKPSMTIVK